MKWMRKTVAPTIWVIVISFALWGVQSVFVGLSKESKGVGTVFGKTISFKAHQDAIRTAEMLMQRPNAEKLPVEVLDRMAWQNIILGIEAKREKISVSDEEVRLEIERLFQQSGGEFNPRFYESWVRQNFKESPRAFEERVREMELVRKLIERHKAIDIPISDEEINQRSINERTTLSVDYLRFDTLEDADKNLETLKEASHWDERKKEEKTDVQSVGPLTIELLKTLLSLSQDDANYLKGLSIGSVSKPIAIGDGFAVFRITGKEEKPETVLDDKTIETYRNEITEQKKREAFSKWWNDVMKRANMKKFKLNRE